ncbi:MAG: nitrite reductase, partial [Flavobacteriaceae bacterium]
EDFIDWGNEVKYEKAIGIGECAGVTIDLIQTLLFEAEEAYSWALSALEQNRFSDAVYHAYNGRIRAAKALLTSVQAKTNSHASIIEGFDEHFPAYAKTFDESFKRGIQEFTSQSADRAFAEEFVQKTLNTIAWIKKERDEQLQ